MKKLLQINPVVRNSTSTGRIMREIGELAMENGWESYVAYSKGRDGVPDHSSRLVPVGGRLSVFWHGVLTRFFDAHGEGSRIATRRFVRRIREMDPDVIHIHNIHGYFLNYRILFEYLAVCGKPVLWTVHDCWLYTGHCYYYTAAGCDRWKSGCGNCPQRGLFPRSLVLDRSRHAFNAKSLAFNSVPKNMLSIVPVSDWIRGEMALSFLKDCKYKVIHNGIDTNVFRPYDNDAEVRARYGTGDRHIILGLASIWSKEKGLDDFVRLSGMIDSASEIVVMVGVGRQQRSLLPENIIAVERTANAAQLAELYSAACVFVNPTWQDNYPTVNLEAISCGTPVVTYHTGGSAESVTPQTGIAVKTGDVDALLDSIRVIENNGKEHYVRPCREYALAHFRKEDRYREYIDLYENIATR